VDNKRGNFSQLDFQRKKRMNIKHLILTLAILGYGSACGAMWAMSYELRHEVRARLCFEQEEFEIVFSADTSDVEMAQFIDELAAIQEEINREGCFTE
jgi:hypothetical protein